MVLTEMSAEQSLAGRFARSWSATDNRELPTAEIGSWLADRRDATTFELHRVPLRQLDKWHTDDHGDLRHESGRFFSIGGLRLQCDSGPVTHWDQPIIAQPEIGILGILVKEFDGVLHCLMQAKVEPGNPNVIQLSPTVQATRSNYERVHEGGDIEYLSHFRSGSTASVLVDVLQSEQGAWFYHKRNRNMVVEATADIDVAEDFCWLTLGQLRGLLCEDNLVNMDARTVLSCIPMHTGLESEGVSRDSLSWFTEVKSSSRLTATPIALGTVRGWSRSDMSISHDEGKYFDVVGVRTVCGSREVAQWCQPLFAPRGIGLIAFVARVRSGMRELLVHARVEAGCRDLVEMAPTVQCVPDNYVGWPVADRPRLLDLVENASPTEVLFDSIQSEEGGRFLDAQNRYQIIEPEGEVPDPGPQYRWMAVAELTDLLKHANYLNVQARSLIALLHCL